MVQERLEKRKIKMQEEHDRYVKETLNQVSLVIFPEERAQVKTQYLHFRLHANYLQTTFFYLKRFRNRLADDQ